MLIPEVDIILGTATGADEARTILKPIKALLGNVAAIGALESKQKPCHGIPILSPGGDRGSR